MKIQIKHRITSAVIVKGEYESIKECLEKNRGTYLQGADLRGADLRGADLQGAYLRGAYLRGADLQGADLQGTYLRGADLRGAKKYLNSHAVFSEIVKRQSIKVFTTSEWKCIAVISLHQICWDTIKKQFGKTAMSVFKKLAKAGFGEWETHYKGVMKQ